MLPLSLALSLACSPAPPVLPPFSHSDLRLPLLLGRQADGLGGSTSFSLPQAVDAGAMLRVEGWWKVDLSLDGQPLPSVFPGFAPASLALPALTAGSHHLSVHVRMPTDEPPRLSLANRMFYPMQGEVWLQFQPEAHITHFAVPLIGSLLKPTVEVSAPPSATVELILSSDGRVLQHWDPVPVAQPWPEAHWTGPRWEIGAPALVQATVVLRAADGSVLDLRSERIGLRSTRLSGGSFILNDQPSPLLAMRVSPLENITPVMQALADVGANAVEIHGVVAPVSWLARFDEWGLPVVLLPRCDGGMVRDPRDLSRLAPQLAEQDQRLMQSATQSPAVLTWICEGASGEQEALCGRYHQDPLQRPVLGLDNLGVSMMGLERTAPFRYRLGD